MSKPLDNELIKEAIHEFIRSHPEFVKQWVNEALATPVSSDYLFPKFDREKVLGSMV